jgi:hypothetical protein
MKKHLTIISMLLFITSFAYSQQDGDNTLWGLPKISLGMKGADTVPALAGRAIAFVPGPNSLDGDDLADIIATDYNTGRVFVFEQAAKNSLDFKLVWASPNKKPKWSGVIPASPQGTPRTVTYGDLDGNGKKEVIFPIGYAVTDSIYSDTSYQRGIYIYECIGDNNYGTAPYIVRVETIDPDTRNYSWGRQESPGFIVADIDNDGQQELLSGTSSFAWDSDLKKNSGKALVISVKSGTFAQKNAVLSVEYSYTKMAKALKNDSDGYIPHGFTLADVDGDGVNEVVVTGRTNQSTGGGIGFFKATGKDQYIDGSIVDLTNKAGLNIFRVTSQLAKYKYQGRDLVFVKTDETSGLNRVLLLQDIIDISLVGQNNFNLIKNVYFGGFTGGATGDQDHGTGSDGFDFYFPYGNSSGGFGVYDMEFNGTGNPADSGSYKMYDIFDARKVLKRCDPGLYQIFNPGYDLNGNGKKEIITNYQFWSFPDTLVQGNIGLKAPMAFFVLEWGDKTIGTVDVKPMLLIMPEDYKLEQNYPNPFNPTTNIKFTLPASENINLTIYDINGREVKKLIDGKHFEKGSYETTWDAKDKNGKNVSSGVYMYKMTWGNFEKSMKMTLLK